MVVAVGKEPRLLSANSLSSFPVVLCWIVLLYSEACTLCIATVIRSTKHVRYKNKIKKYFVQKVKRIGAKG